MNTVLIFPEPGNTKFIAQSLLSLADKASDVEFVLWPAEGFRVPEELALKFEAEFVAPYNEVVPVAQAHAESEGRPTAAEVEVKRKPGRPKKEAR